MKMYRTLAPVYITVLLLAIGLMLSPQMKASAPSITDSEEISALLSDAKAETIELREDAEKMQAYARPPHLSSQSFSDKIEEIRQHLNRTAKLVAQMEQSRGLGAPWQQHAIDHIMPPLKEMADNIRSTIEYLNEHRGQENMRETSQYCKLNADLATELAAVVAEFSKYGETQGKLEELEKKIGAR